MLLKKNGGFWLFFIFYKFKYLPGPIYLSISEDGKKWGYWFDGKGNVHALRYPEGLPEKQELYNS
jgi:hypothetical protein